MQRRVFFSLCLTAILSTVSGCLLAANDGPGMVVTFVSLIQGRTIEFKKTRLPNGREFSSPGAIGGRRPSNWRNSGKTMGVAGDSRELPEWVEFEWQEPSYPSLRMKDYSSLDDFDKAVHEKFRNLPVKTQRVPVRDRIPQDILQEVIQSRKDAPSGKLPDKKLWVYFVWADSGVKFHWRLISGASTELRSGGDDIDAL